MVNECILDCDGVLADFIGGIYKVHGVEKCVYDEPDSKGKWDVAALLGIDPVDFYKPCGRDFWEDLEPTPEAHEIVALARKSFAEVYVATAPTRNPDCATGKLLWLEKHFPELAGDYFVTRHKHKLAAPGRVLFDDSDVNVNKFIACGGRGVLVPRPWNVLWTKDTLSYLREIFAQANWQ